MTDLQTDVLNLLATTLKDSGVQAFRLAGAENRANLLAAELTAMKHSAARFENQRDRAQEELRKLQKECGYRERKATELHQAASAFLDGVPANRSPLLLRNRLRVALKSARDIIDEIPF